MTCPLLQRSFISVMKRETWPNVRKRPLLQSVSDLYPQKLGQIKQGKRWNISWAFLFFPSFHFCVCVCMWLPSSSSDLEDVDHIRPPHLDPELLLTSSLRISGIAFCKNSNCILFFCFKKTSSSSSSVPPLFSVYQNARKISSSVSFNVHKTILQFYRCC